MTDEQTEVAVLRSWIARQRVIASLHDPLRAAALGLASEVVDEFLASVSDGESSRPAHVPSVTSPPRLAIIDGGLASARVGERASTLEDSMRAHPSARS